MTKAEDDAGDRPAIFEGHERTLLFSAYRPLVRHAGVLRTARSTTCSSSGALW